MKICPVPESPHIAGPRSRIAAEAGKFIHPFGTGRSAIIRGKCLMTGKARHIAAGSAEHKRAADHPWDIAN